ncbi:MAG: hypothetical protein AB9866_20860 [Syntrophobacteraceae bacterium]
MIFKRLKESSALPDGSHVFDALTTAIGEDLKIDNLLGLLTSIRTAIAQLFGSFEYEIWFHDRFDDQRKDVLYSMFASSVMIEQRPRIFDFSQKNGPEYKAFKENKIIQFSGMADEKGKLSTDIYKISIYAPISYGTTIIGVLGIYVKDNAKRDLPLDNLIKPLTLQLFFLVRIFFLSLEKDLFNAIKKLKLIHNGNYQSVHVRTAETCGRENTKRRMFSFSI